MVNNSSFLPEFCSEEFLRNYGSGNDVTQEVNLQQFSRRVLTFIINTLKQKKKDEIQRGTPVLSRIPKQATHSCLSRRSSFDNSTIVLRTEKVNKSATRLRCTTHYCRSNYNYLPRYELKRFHSNPSKSIRMNKNL